MMLSTLSMFKCNTFKTNSRQWVDRFGTCASSLCAIHCLLMPFAIASIPMMGTGVLASSELEWIMIGIAITLGALAAARGFRIHGERITLVLLCTGIVLLLSSRLAHADLTEACCALHDSSSGTYPLHSVLAVCGGLLVASSHLCNQYFCKRCEQCQN